MIKKKFSAAAVVFAVMMMITTTAFAAWYFLKPSEVADKFNDTALSAAFGGDTAVNINQSITSGDYTFTLLAILSGKDLSDYPSYYNGEIRSDRTYAVLAIQNADGTPMAGTQDEAYGQVSFIASPLIKGQQPWNVNAWTLKGGYSETVTDGVMYRIVECDSVTMFADRGVYLGVATGSFINNTTFIYDGSTGEIKANPDYDGSSAVFELPIDKSLADPEKAQKYLDTLWDAEDTTGAETPTSPVDSDITIDLVEGGYISKQVMTYDTLKEHIEKELKEIQKMVDNDGYSQANIELSRLAFEEKLKDIENGNTVTLYRYEDGKSMLATTYPDSGFDADVDASGGIVITN